VEHPGATSVELRLIDSAPHVVDTSQGVAFPLPASSKGKRGGKRAGEPVDVWSLFKVLEEFVGEDHFAVVAVSSLLVAEEGDAAPLMGRACGNRVSVVR